jgi:hypothetical protein
MDADDRMQFDRLKKQYKFMETNPDIDICVLLHVFCSLFFAEKISLNV